MVRSAFVVGCAVSALLWAPVRLLGQTQPIMAKVCGEGLQSGGAFPNNFPILYEEESGFAPGGSPGNDMLIVGSRGQSFRNIFMAGMVSGIGGAPTPEQIDQLAANVEVVNDRNDTVRVELAACKDAKPLMHFALPGGTYYSLMLEPGTYALTLRTEREGRKYRIVLRERGDGQTFHVQYDRALPRIPSSAVTRFGTVPSNAAGDNIQREIARIRNGRNAPMPAAQASAASLGGQTRMVIENSTTYTLTVLLSGPMSQRIQLAPGGSQALALSPGSYEIAASVSSANVIPFYGKETLSPNTQYSEKFYIAPK